MCLQSLLRRVAYWLSRALNLFSVLEFWAELVFLALHVGQACIMWHRHPDMLHIALPLNVEAVARFIAACAHLWFRAARKREDRPKHAHAVCARMLAFVSPGGMGDPMLRDLFASRHTYRRYLAAKWQLTRVSELVQKVLKRFPYTDPAEGSQQQQPAQQAELLAAHAQQQQLRQQLAAQHNELLALRAQVSQLQQENVRRQAAASSG